MKKQEGITLIALVITIIVLLILAGVTIAMLSGENGILSRATQARANTRITNMEEIISVNIADQVSKYYEDVYVNSGTNLKMGTYVKNGIDQAKKSLEANITVETTVAGTEEASGLVGKTITVTDSAAKKKAIGTVKENGIIIWAEVVDAS